MGKNQPTSLGKIVMRGFRNRRHVGKLEQVITGILSSDFPRDQVSRVYAKHDHFGSGAPGQEPSDSVIPIPKLSLLDHKANDTRLIRQIRTNARIVERLEQKRVAGK